MATPPRTHASAGAQHPGDDIDELSLELQPQFTEQDEQRELATLTIQELTELHRSKRKGPRNIVDPRMAKAVRAKQDDPELSLRDALTSGGFAFSQKGSGTTDNDMFDEDDVSIRQRKNNLSRRLRGERGKNKERASEPVDDGTTPATQNQASAAAMARRDSFDEAIQGLPGLDGLGDLDVAFDEESLNG